MRIVSKYIFTRKDEYGDLDYVTVILGTSPKTKKSVYLEERWNKGNLYYRELTPEQFEALQQNSTI